MQMFRLILCATLAVTFTATLAFCERQNFDAQRFEVKSAENNKTSKSKETVTIGLVYQNYARSKVYDKAFKEAIRNINQGQSIMSLRKIAMKYSLAHVDCVLPKGRFYPSDVLDCLCETMIRNRVALIVFVTAAEDYDETTSAAQYFLHMASQSGIPIIAWNADNSGFTFTKPMSAFRIVQMAPPIQHQIRAMIALLKRYNWSRFGVMAAKMAGSQQFLKLVLDETQRHADDRSFKPEVVHHEEIDVALDQAHIQSRLEAFRNSEARIILLYSSASKAKKIFQVAESLGLLSEKYLWIGTQSVKGTMPTVVGATQPGMLTISFHTVSNAMFPPADDVLPMIIGLAPKLFALGLAKLALNESVSLASNSTCTSQENRVNGGAIWPMGQRIYDKMIASFLKANPHHNKDGLHSFFYLFNEDGTLRDSYLFISNLRTKRTKEPNIQPTFYWDKVGEFTNGKLRMADIEWPEGRANPPPGTPDKFHVRVVTLNEPPFVIVSELDPETGQCPGRQGAVCDWGNNNTTVLKCCTGYCVDLLNKFAADIGFTYSLYKVHDEKWGLKTETGWNGLVRDLLDHAADLCVTSLKLNSERARDIDFSVPFLETGITMLVKIRSGVLSPTAFLEPFEYSTWLIILCVSIQGAALSIFLFEWLSPNSFNMKPYPPPGHRFSLFRSYWLVWATLFSASVSTNVPRSPVSRVMSLIWAAFGLTFLAVYTANLAAFMITRIQFYDLSGIDDPRIVYPEEQNPKFRYGTVEGGNTHEIMKRNWRHMDAYVRRNAHFRANVHAGTSAVRKDELDAFIYDAVVLDYLSGKDPNCELLTVGKWSSMTGYAFGFPKNSPYVKRFNQFMLQYQHKGELERLQNFWLTGACNRDSNSNSQTTSAPLGVENFLSAFFLLFGGILMSLLCLGGEFVYCHHIRRLLQKLGLSNWCGLISMSLGKSLSFSDAVERLRAWQSRIHSLQSNSSATADARLFRLRWMPMPILPKSKNVVVTPPTSDNKKEGSDFGDNGLNNDNQDNNNNRYNKKNSEKKKHNNNNKNSDENDNNNRNNNNKNSNNCENNDNNTSKNNNKRYRYSNKERNENNNYGNEMRQNDCMKKEKELNNNDNDNETSEANNKPSDEDSSRAAGQREIRCALQISI